MSGNQATKGVVWASEGEARFTAQPHVQVADEGGNPSAITDGRPSVAVYVDLLAQRSDTAFARYVEENSPFLVAWRHLTSVTEALLDPSAAGLIAAELAAHMRTIGRELQRRDTPPATFPLPNRASRRAADQHTSVCGPRMGRFRAIRPSRLPCTVRTHPSSAGISQRRRD